MPVSSALSSYRYYARLVTYLRANARSHPCSGSDSGGTSKKKTARFSSTPTRGTYPRFHSGTYTKAWVPQLQALCPSDTAVVGQLQAIHDDESRVLRWGDLESVERAIEVR